jgi:hypothetical protein
MKYILSLALASSLSVSESTKVLPPGYEDTMWCPPGDCRVYSNPWGIGAGPLSSYYHCYSNVTNVTEAVWTGSLTDVVPPEGWVEPVNCTAEEYSECESDEDCTMTARNWVPIDEEILGGEQCSCYAESAYHPFDQCQGVTQNKRHCSYDDCDDRGCSNFDAVCIIAENGAGACLKEYDNSRAGDDDFFFYDDDDDKTTPRPTRKPSRKPSKKPSRKPSRKPSKKPSPKDTDMPTVTPTFKGNTCGDKCKKDDDCFHGGFVQCGVCNLVHGTEGYGTCIEATSSPTKNPVATPCPFTYMPVCCDGVTYDNDCVAEANGAEAESCVEGACDMSTPMEDMFNDKKKSRTFVRGSSNVVKSEHEYYDGGYVEEEEVDFGRNHVVKAIA